MPVVHNNNNNEDTIQHFVSNEQQQQYDTRTYDPYLIAYHKETQTFTYNDPWSEVTHEDVDSSSYDGHSEDFSAYSLPTTTTHSIDTCSTITEDVSTESGFFTETPSHDDQTAAVLENIVDHVTEVSCISLTLTHSFSRARLKK
jgi:hypothetical protein